MVCRIARPKMAGGQTKLREHEVQGHDKRLVGHHHRREDQEEPQLLARHREARQRKACRHRQRKAEHDGHARDNGRVADIDPDALLIVRDLLVVFQTERRRQIGRRHRRGFRQRAERGQKGHDQRQQHGHDHEKAQRGDKPAFGPSRQRPWRQVEDCQAHYRRLRVWRRSCKTVMAMMTSIRITDKAAEYPRSKRTKPD